MNHVEHHKSITHNNNNINNINNNNNNSITIITDSDIQHIQC